MLFDTNVLVAITLREHPGHRASIGAWQAQPVRIIAAHSLAELANTLTKPGGYAIAPGLVRRAIVTLSSQSSVYALSGEQTRTGVLAYLDAGGVGARIYDRLIGEVAGVRDVTHILTWNVRHMRPLFPLRTVLTPDDYLETL